MSNEGLFNLFAWVIMPEHVHLLLQPAKADVGVETILRKLKSPVARSILDRWRQLDAPILDRRVDRAGRTRFWQAGGGFDKNIECEREF